MKKKLIIIVIILVIIILSMLSGFAIGRNTINLKEISNDLNMDNPIDNFFDEVASEISGSTPINGFISTLYRKAWEEEMNNAYDKLYEIAHPEIKQELSELKQTNNFFANKYNFLGMSSWSNVYDKKQDYSEDILYGTGAIMNGNYYAATIFKKSTLDIFEILRNYDFIFDETKYKEELSETYHNEIYKNR